MQNPTKFAAINPLATAPIVVDRSHNFVKVEWQAPRQTKNLVGYIIEYKVEPGNWQQHGTMVEHSNNNVVYRYDVSGLLPNTEVFIRIRLVGKNNIRSNPSPEVSDKTKCIGKCIRRI